MIDLQSRLPHVLRLLKLFLLVSEKHHLLALKEHMRSTLKDNPGTQHINLDRNRTHKILPCWKRESTVSSGCRLRAGAVTAGAFLPSVDTRLMLRSMLRYFTHSQNRFSLVCLSLTTASGEGGGSTHSATQAAWSPDPIRKRVFPTSDFRSSCVTNIGRYKHNVSITVPRLYKRCPQNDLGWY